MLTVELRHSPNPDVAGGYWCEPIDPRKAVRLGVTSLAQASTACRTYIERNSLGGGNWTGGKIRDGSKVVATVSYNGRVWNPDGSEAS